MLDYTFYSLNDGETQIFYQKLKKKKCWVKILRHIQNSCREHIKKYNVDSIICWILTTFGLVL